MPLDNGVRFGLADNGMFVDSVARMAKASLNFAQGYLQKKKLVFTGNKGQNLPDFGLYY